MEGVVDMNEEASIPENSQLKQLSYLVRKAVDAASAVEACEGGLKDLKKRYKDLVQQEIPDAMLEAGVEAFETAEGLKVSVKNDICVSIPKAREKEALSWLRDNELGDIVRNVVTVNFGRGEDTEKAVYISFLGEQGKAYQTKEGVHSGTLKASLKELRENGVDFPEDLFGVFDYKEAKIR